MRGAIPRPPTRCATRRSSCKAGASPLAARVVEWAREAEQRGAGEILLTSMDSDGTRAGFDCELTAAVSEAVGIPVIASGGAGTVAHFADVFARGKADAALAASIFHFGVSSFALAQRRARASRRSGEAAMLIPSIDLLGGRIVQLVQGEKLRLAFDDFEYWIEKFSRFPLVQLIDLDAAMRQGDNSALVEQIAQAAARAGRRRHPLDRARAAGAGCGREARHHRLGAFFRGGRGEYRRLPRSWPRASARSAWSPASTPRMAASP